MELLRNSKDKKARKLTKKRVSCCGFPLSGRLADDSQLGTLLRSKRKLEELASVIQEQRRQTAAH
jgi:large subunit ribosomal protein L36e